MAAISKDSSVFRIQKTDETEPDEPITPVEDLKGSEKITNLPVTKTTEIIKDQHPSSISEKTKLDKTDKTVSLDHTTTSQIKTKDDRSFPDAKKMTRKIPDETTGTLTIQNFETKSNQSTFPASSASEVRLNSRNEAITEQSQIISSNQNLLITHPISNKTKNNPFFYNGV
ncbi:hypothetical protein WUBG_09913 [Wuchereria bancrofti]|uniref:Uncharacterized protein n=1 Tax=Wuchereria bancrofti TaxID=6293 RepID=J9EAK9_WUCBA|nr:hypothetical protein WUBG_09913 [Wuchereria bancrofti]